MTDAATWTKALSLVGIVFVAYLLLMWAVMVFWTHRDIASRTTDRMQQVVAVAIVAVFSLPGLLVYLALRPPETSAELLVRQLEAEALVQERLPACPGCGYSMRSDFVACPYCRTSVETSCLSCTRGLRAAWVLCPYCGADRPVAAATGPARSLTSPELSPILPQETLEAGPAPGRVLAHR